mmetsp:Transcript_12971/g.35578  ORF Transcript_12971/g.35578 Transcript_12971/m.35578 type:complete len:304 (+) Transcript_12971:207-1118(+)
MAAAIQRPRGPPERHHRRADHRNGVPGTDAGARGHRHHREHPGTVLRLRPNARVRVCGHVAARLRVVGCHRCDPHCRSAPSLVGHKGPHGTRIAPRVHSGLRPPDHGVVQDGVCCPLPVPPDAERIRHWWLDPHHCSAVEELVRLPDLPAHRGLHLTHPDNTPALERGGSSQPMPWRVSHHPARPVQQAEGLRQQADQKRGPQRSQVPGHQAHDRDEGDSGGGDWDHIRLHHSCWRRTNPGHGGPHPLRSAIFPGAMGHSRLPRPGERTEQALQLHDGRRPCGTDLIPDHLCDDQEDGVAIRL